jgi:hypothetical protein
LFFLCMDQTFVFLCMFHNFSLEIGCFREEIMEILGLGSLAALGIIIHWFIS